MLEEELSTKAQALAALMEKHLGARGKTLEASLRRAGRQLPKGLRAKAQMLVEAEQMAKHPKLVRRIDESAVKAACNDLEVYLKGIDHAERRKTRALNIAAGLALNLLILVVAFLVFLRWRGLI